VGRFFRSEDTGNRRCPPSKNRAPPYSYPSFPRKREPRDFSRLPLGPRVRGDDEFAGSKDIQTPSTAGVPRVHQRSRNRYPAHWEECGAAEL
jgi:hypothetical protein